LNYTLKIKLSKLKQNILIFFIICIFGFAAIYFQVNFSKDYQTYLDVFDSNSTSIDGSYKVEYSAKVISEFGWSPFFIICTYVIFGFYLKCISFFSQKNALLNTVIYLLSYFLLFEGTAIRLSLALGFLMYALILYNKKKKIAFLFFILSFFFHYSTLVALLLMFSWRKAIFIILLFTTIIYLATFFNILNSPYLMILLDSRFSNYMENRGDANTIFNTKFLFIITLIFIYLKNRIIFRNNEKILISLFALSISFLSLFYNSAFFTRIVDIFLVLSFFQIVPCLEKKHFIEKVALISVSSLTFAALLFRGWLIG
jgi:hypothetical protein